MDEIRCPLCGQNKIEFMSKCSCGFDFENLNTTKDTVVEIKQTNKKQKHIFLKILSALFFPAIVLFICHFIGISANVSKLIAAGVAISILSSIGSFKQKK